MQFENLIILLLLELVLSILVSIAYHILYSLLYFNFFHIYIYIYLFICTAFIRNSAILIYIHIPCYFCAMLKIYFINILCHHDDIIEGNLKKPTFLLEASSAEVCSVKMSHT